MIRNAAILLSLFSWIDEAWAHELRPALLQITEVSQEAGPAFEVVWKVPVGGRLPQDLYVVMPPHCSPANESRHWFGGNYRIEHWRTTCPGGLQQHSLRVNGLETGLMDVLVRVQLSDDGAHVGRLTPTSNAYQVARRPSLLSVAGTYLLLGIEHILLGIDHLLFVLALLMIVVGWRRLVATITAFTVAHSITLGAAAMGWVRAPLAPVEAIIALSIVFVSVEIVRSRGGQSSITAQSPWIVAFAFGLLHGFGFAGALAEIGLPDLDRVPALLFFNLGVEAGQLAFVAAVLLAWSLLQRLSWPRFAWRFPVYAIGTIAAFWTLERLVAVFNLHPLQ